MSFHLNGPTKDLVHHCSWRERVRHLVLLPSSKGQLRAQSAMADLGCGRLGEKIGSTTTVRYGRSGAFIKHNGVDPVATPLWPQIYGKFI